MGLRVVPDSSLPAYPSTVEWRLPLHSPDMLMNPGKITRIGLGAVLVFVALTIGKSCYDASVVKRATQDASLKRFAHDLDSLNRLIVQSDKKIQRDTVVLNRAVTRYVTLRDTITITDTVQVKVALARCDSVVSAVGPAIQSLKVGIETRNATILDQDSTIKVLNARFPSKLRQAGNDGKWALIGAAADELIHTVKRRR